MGWWRGFSFFNLRVRKHPFGKPLRAAFVVAEWAVRGISHPSYLLFADVAELRNFFPGKKIPRIIVSDLKQALLVVCHPVIPYVWEIRMSTA